jgi:DeoR/GlpR family transcriptional regulator of sugar metabolism
MQLETQIFYLKESRDQMLAIERRNKILTILQKENRVLVSDLSKAFDVTEETIRRDLEKLEQEGFAKKTYGGAIATENAYTDQPFTVRKTSNVLKKQAIAEIVASIVQDGDHIMLDSSSTSGYIAKQLKNKKNLTIITNSVEILLDTSEITGWKVISTGGLLREGSLSLLGHQAEQVVSNYHVDKAIISCKGVDLERGISDSTELEAYIKQQMIASANTTILAVDSSKLEKTSFIKICDLGKVDVIVTDEVPDEKWNEVLATKNVELITKANS